jgi:hypothetical protein
MGCGRSLPLTLQTASGTLPAGPGPGDTCEFTCDQVYVGQVAPGACSDCGNGVSAALGPGMTADIQWDRRVYSETTINPQCTGGAATGSCAYGTRVAPAASQAGVLSVCTSMTGLSGACSSSDTVAFTIDTTQSAGTIEVP